MTQEEKQLLLVDLCARLPYSTLIYAQNDIDWYESEICTQVLSDVINEDYVVKPYLFPLSSMTERQCYELSSIRSSFQDCWKYIKTPIPLSICNFEQIEWFHKNHFDYRGLIEKGLAIDATGLNIYSL